MTITVSQQNNLLILVVDDDKLMRIQLRRAMEQAGYKVVEASDGKQALDAYTRLNPDIVLLDALMPVMDGFTCCKKIRAMPGGDRIPILTITALDDRESVDRAFEAGASDYITKPIHWDVVRQRVHRLLQASQSMEELRQQTQWAQLKEEQLRLALEAAHMGTWDWDILSGKVTYVNTEVNLGLAPDTFNGTYESFLERVHPEDREFVNQSVHRAIEEEANYNIEYRVLWSDNSVHWVASKGKVYYDETSSVAVRMTAINMDITERQRVEEELKRQNVRSQLFANISLNIRQSLQLDNILQTTVTEVQKLLQADRVLLFRLWSDGSGSVVKEAVVPGWMVILGQTILDPCFQQDYVQKYRQGRIRAIPDVEKADIRHCHIEFLQQFGVKANLVVPILLKEELWGLLIAHQCTAPRQWSSFELELLQQIADQISIALAQSHLLEEETRQREELARSNAELQQFASIASHDLQEPLRKIQAFGNRLKTTYSDTLTEQGHDYLERMQNAAHRMQVLIDDLLTLSRITTRTQPFVKVNLAQVTQEVLSDLELLIQQTGGRVEVGSLPTIDGEPLQMRQLIQNLIGNALKFHQDQKPPVVKIYSKILEQERRLIEDSPVVEVCQLTVEDNGIGFDEKYLDRIFNVFQRLHSRSEYAGTGVGLAICRKIAERHGGSITAHSVLGRGATFIVTLPITSS